MSVPITENQLSAIRKALFEGRKIEAIKLYRKATSAGLAEAKDAVEKLEQELRASSSEKFTSVPAGKGCFVMMMTICAFVLLILLLAVRSFGNANF